ncbi:MAG: energy transducer TonB [Candidatus Omnitrophica bacterium]|nr:energy transducer TonB [Candidatus Omnitrophota bacterium]
MPLPAPTVVYETPVETLDVTEEAAKPLNQNSLSASITPASSAAVFLPEMVERAVGKYKEAAPKKDGSTSDQIAGLFKKTTPLPRRSTRVARVEDIDLSDVLVFKVFNSYYHKLSFRIKGHIRYPAEVVREQKEGMVYVSFVLHRKGQISDLKIVESSGDPRFDKAAVQAIKKSAPFPSFPLEIIESKMTLYLPVSFEVD